MSKLWHRRFLVNQIRQQYEQQHHIEYDWVIRTRFDIGYSPSMPRNRLHILHQPPDPLCYYARPDIFACGCPDVINYESLLTDCWPYMYGVYKRKGQLPASCYVQTSVSFNRQECDINMVYLHKWLFMSEENLVSYFTYSPYQLIELPRDLNIIRPP